jgi:capsule polysaccharide export protein KpsE/RkpR
MTEYAHTYRTAALTAKRTLEAALDIEAEVQADDANARKLATKLTLVQSALDVLRSASAPAPVDIEQIKARLRAALDRNMGTRVRSVPASDICTDLADEVMKMIEEARS